MKRRERRQGSRGWLMKLGVALVIALPVAYFVFTRVFFDPFEGSQPPFPALVPREVDVFVHREALAADMGDFPEPREMGRLRRTRAFRELSQTAWWQELQWPRDLEAAATEARAALEQAPLDPMVDLAGREVAVVGRLPQGGAGDAQYALLARISNRTKLALELLDYDAALQRALPGATLSVVDDPDRPGLSYRRLDLPADGSAGASGGPWYFARKQDLLIVGQAEAFVRDLLRATESGPEASLGLSRLYHEHLPPMRGSPDERFSADFLLDLEQLLARLEAGDTLAEKHPDALLNALSQLVDPRLFGEVVGRLEVDSDIRLHAHADLAAPDATIARAGLLGAPSFKAGERLGAMAGLLPSDISAVVSMNIELRPLLTTIFEALGPDELELLNGTIRDLARYSPNWKVDNVQGLVTYLSRTLGDELTVAIRPLDHVVPKGSQPLPLIAVILHVKDLKLWNELDDAVVRGSKALGVPDDKRLKVEEGVGTRKWLGVIGLPMEEFSYIVLDPDVPANSGTAIIGTADVLVHEIVSVYTNSRSSLATKLPVREAVAAFGEARANFVGWASAEAVRTILQPYAEWVAEDDTRLDLVPIRLNKRKELLASPEFAQYRGQDTLPEDAEKLLEARLDALVGEVEARRLNEDVPKLAAAWLESHQWLTLLKSVGVALRLGDRDADLHVLVETVVGS